MLLVFAVIVTAIAAWSVLRARLADDRSTLPHLGQMSERWLAEHRAAHPSSA
jgi:hypothetical protein